MQLKCIGHKDHEEALLTFFLSVLASPLKTERIIRVDGFLARLQVSEILYGLPVIYLFN